MQRISKLLLTKSHLFVGIIAVICLLAALLGITANINMQDSQPIVANAATTISDATAFANAFKTSGTVSGDFVLGADFTVSSNHISEATFSGTLDGQGHTITITGTHSNSYNDVDKYLGFLCGTFSGRISNLNIVVNGVITSKITNSRQTSGDYNYSSTYSNTLYIGTIAGRAAQNAQLNNVNVKIGSTSIVSGIGIDGNSGAEHYASGQGAVVGGLFGVTQGATLTNVMFTNNGSIWARGENKSGGYYSYKSGGFIGIGQETIARPIYLTDSTRPDRASAGGLFGEASSSTTTINSLVIAGNGYVGAKAYGAGGGDYNGGDPKSYIHNINFAGGVVGYAKGGKITINGMLYKYNGVAYVGYESKDGIKYAGTISGKATNSSDITINYLWRNPSEGLNSGYGISTKDDTSTGPSLSSLSISPSKRLSSSKTLASVATQDSSLTVTINNANETSIDSYYDGTKIASEVATITNIKDKMLSFSVNVASPYYFSALYYKTSDVDYTYINYYEKEITRSATIDGDDYSVPISCKDVMVYLTDIVTQDLYIECKEDKQYNRTGISFVGKPTKESPGILPNLRWVAVANGDLNSDHTIMGDLGSEIVVSHQDVGNYEFKLYKELEDGTLTPALNGDNLGPDRLNAPTKIFRFDGKSFSYEITHAQLGLRAAKNATYSRPYNATSTVLSSDLIINKHYEFYRIDDNTQLTDETPSISIGEGHFYDSNDNKTSSVSTGLTVKIEGFSVSGNYSLSQSPTTTLTMTGCSITPRGLGIAWDALELTYDGSLLYPNATALNTINNDAVKLVTTVYMDETGFNKVAKTEAGTYWARVMVDDTDPVSSNYTFNTTINQQFTVLPRELRLAWTNFEKEYNGSTQSVSCSIIDKATEVASGDTVNLAIKYYIDDPELSVSLLNAASYTAVASINNTNYYINADDVTYGDGEGEYIEITPINVEVIYYTGSNNTSSVVNKLTYIDESYIGNINGLHARLDPAYTGMNILNGHIYLSYEEDVKNVGIYNVTAYLDYLENGNDSADFIISNYAIANDSVQVEVVPRELTLEISTTRSFEYDITFTDIQNIDITCDEINNVAGDDIVALSKTVYYYQNDTKGDRAETSNVGEYLVVFEIINNPNYYLNTATSEVEFEIYTYNIGLNNRVKLTAISDSYVYSGTDIIPEIDMSKFVKLPNGLFLSNGEHFSVSYSNNKDAGNNAIVKVEGIGNYTGAITTNFTIEKRLLEVEFDSPTSLTYNGQDRSVEYHLIGLDEYADAETIKSYTSIKYSQTPHYVNSNYIATVYFRNEQKNYKLKDDEASRSWNFAITPLDVIVIYSNTADKVYNGTSQKVTVECNDFFGGDSVSLKDDYYSKSLKKTIEPQNVGYYDVQVSLVGERANNYNILNPTYSDYYIKPRSIKLDFTSSNYQKTYLARDLSLVFNTDYYISSETPAVQGENTGIYLTYQPEEGAAINKVSNVGTYSILYGTTNTNYQIVNADVNPTITIAPAELKLYVTTTITTSTYAGVNKKVNIPYGFAEGGKPLGSDSFEPIMTYYNVNDPTTLITTGIYEVGVYKMLFTLPIDNVQTKNYVFNAESLAQAQSFEYTITPSPITVDFVLSNEKVYDGESIECNQVSLLNITSGVLDNDQILLDVEVTKDGGTDLVQNIKDVGSYTITFKLNESVINYVLKSGVSTRKTYKITPKEVSFFFNNFSKIYGNIDGEIIQEITTDIGETIIVTFNREKTVEDKVGSYPFLIDTIKVIENGENELIAQNYKIVAAGETLDKQHGTFTILPRNIDFNPDGDPSTPEIDPFYFDYLDPITPEKLVYIHKVETAALGLQEIKIQLEPADASIVNMGTYDLKTSFTPDNNNFVCTMVEGSHLNKIVIRGRSVQITFNDLYITYGDDDPNFYNHIYISDTDILKCDQNIQNAYQEYKDNNGGSAVGFDWSKYILITPEAVSSNLAVGRPYKENGYKLTLEFLNKDNVVDPNYRAVRLITDENGNATTTSETARLYVRKFDLNSVYGDGQGLKKPEVVVEKAYDGKIIANILNANIDEAHAQQQLTVYADYDSAESGIGNKTITVRYAFKVAEYGNNYILPNDFVYTETATINPLTVEVSIDQQDINLTYGETPSITLSYKGFINNNNINTEGIKLSGIYADGVSLDTIRDVTETAYTIVLKLDTCLTKNYIVSYDDTVSVKFTRKSIALIAGKTYEKAVDGTNSVSLTAENYVLDGLLEQDKNFVHIESSNITAMLNSAEPGETFVRMSITEISGNKSGNYILSNYELTIPAIVKKLADVTLADAEYDFDNTQKPIVPVLENVLDGVKHYLEYTGINVQYATSRQAPKNAGTYKVVCYVQNEDGSYNRAMAEAELVINKITPNLYFTGTFTQTYGSFAPIEAAVKASGLDQKVNVTYSFVEEDGIFPDFPPAGKHTVKAEYDETANYLPISGERTLEIKQKAISITFDNYKGLVYNGYSRENDITVTFNGVVKGDDCTPVKLFSADSVKNAGTYRLIVSPSNPSYMISGSNAIEFTIAKKLLKVSVGNDVVTEAGVAPKFTMQYEGFVENEDESDLEVAPSVRLTTGKVGVNLVDYKEGMDENYTFNYIKCVYTITYASENEGKTNYTPYIATGVAVGSIGLIFLIAYLVKIYNYRSITKYVAKRTIKKAMFKSKNIK